MPNAGLPHIGCTACQTCGAHSTCRTPFFSGVAGFDAPKDGAGAIMIVNDMPSFEEDAEGDLNPTYGRAYKLLRRTLRDAGVNPDKAFYTLAVRCTSEDDKTPSVKRINLCREFLLNEIEDKQPKAILLLGNPPLQALFKRSGVTKARRQTFFYTAKSGKKIPVVCAFAPAFVLRDANQTNRFKGDIRYFVSVVKGKARTLDAVVVNQAPSVADIERFHACAVEEKRTVAFDVEATTLQPYLSDDWLLLCVGISDGRETLVVHQDYGSDGTGKRLQSTPQMEALFALLEDSAVRKIAHNAKYDMHVLKASFDVTVRKLVADTMLLHAHCFPIRGGHDLKDVASEILKIGNYEAELEKYIGRGKKDPARYAKIPADILGLYCGRDCYCTHRVYFALLRELSRMDAVHGEDGISYLKPSDAFAKITMRVVPAFADIERTGIGVDLPYLDTLEASLEAQRKSALQAIRKDKNVKRFERAQMDAVHKLFQDKRKAGRKFKPETYQQKLKACVFNPGSTKDVAEIVYSSQYYGMSIVKKTQGGEPSTNMDMLKAQHAYPKESAQYKALADYRAFVESLETYKSAKTVLSTFVTGLRAHIAGDGRVHPSFRPNGTDTGRISCADPNLQNIPARADIRRIYCAVPPQGYKHPVVFVEPDYSQIELRILAAMSEDENMIEILSSGKDIHTSTAMSVFGRDKPEDVSAEERRACKPVNFGIAYGMGAPGLAAALTLDLERPVEFDEAQKFIDGFYSAYPRVYEWQMETRRFAEKRGYVYTLFGTRRLIGNAKLISTTRDNLRLREEAMRQAVNTPIQGTAAQCALVAIIAMRKAFRQLPYLARIISTVHDSIPFEVDERFVRPTCSIAKKIMIGEPMRWIGRYMCGVPIEVDFKAGKNWGDAKPLTD